MTERSEIEVLKASLLSDDWGKMKASASRLLELEGDDVFDFLVGLLELDNKHNYSRNIAALTLVKMGDNRAVEPLFNAILKKENINYNGTLVYALEGLNCSLKFRDLFDILFYHGYEAKVSAHAILSEQQFLFDNEDIIYISATWDNIKSHPEIYNEGGNSMALIEDAVTQYLPYLESN